MSLLFLVLVNLLFLVLLSLLFLEVVSVTHSVANVMHDTLPELQVSLLYCCSGHTHNELKLDCAFTPSDAHVISGSEDGKSWLYMT